MSLVYIGKISLATLCPTSFSALAGITLGLTTPITELGLTLTALGVLSAEMTIAPPDLSAFITLLGTLTVGISLSFPVFPSLNFQVAGVAQLLATLSPLVANISLALGPTLALSAVLGASGIFMYSWAGEGLAFGNDLRLAVGPFLPDGTGLDAQVSGYIFAATASGTWTGMETFFTAITTPAQGAELVGSLSLASICGTLATALNDSYVKLTAAFANFNAQLQGALSLSASLTLSPPTLSASITLAFNLLAALEAMITSGAFIPGFAQITLVANLVASITAEIAAIHATLTAVASLTTALGTAGVLVYTYSGSASDLFGDLSSHLASHWDDGTPSSNPANAMTLLVSQPTTAGILSGFFGGA